MERHPIFLLQNINVNQMKILGERSDDCQNQKTHNQANILEESKDHECLANPVLFMHAIGVGSFVWTKVVEQQHRQIRQNIFSI